MWLVLFPLLKTGLAAGFSVDGISLVRVMCYVINSEFCVISGFESVVIKHFAFEKKVPVDSTFSTIISKVARSFTFQLSSVKYFLVLKCIQTAEDFLRGTNGV